MIPIKIGKINRLEGNSRVKAFVEVTFDGFITVYGVRLVEGDRGLFVSLPQNKGNDGKFYSIVKVNNKSVQEALEQAVIAAYNKEYDFQEPGAVSDEPF